MITTKKQNKKYSIYNLIVYKDIIHYQSGDSYSLLLGMINKGNFGDVVSISYNIVYYVPVSKSYIKAIYIEIKTDCDTYVDFVYSPPS